MIIPAFYFVTTSMMRVALLAIARWKVEGKERVPAKGPFIMVSNHLSFVDPPVIAAGVPRRIVFMAKDELLRSPIGGLAVRGYGAFGVRRGGPDRKALHRADATLKKGLALGMFPEGRRSSSCHMEEASVGVSLIALRAGVPLLPVGISGSEQIDGFKTFIHRPNITVRIGEPFMLPAELKADKASLAAATEIIMAHIAELLPENYRGVYSSRPAHLKEASGDSQS